jgi:hypothetical protein
MVAAPDIGAIGYASERRVLDTAGLVTPPMVPLLEREPLEDVVAHLRFRDFSRPGWILDRGPVEGDLARRSPYAAALVPVGSSRVSTLGIARPGPTVYTMYRVRWEAVDSLDAAR